jgi:signal peptidase
VNAAAGLAPARPEAVPLPRRLSRTRAALRFARCTLAGIVAGIALALALPFGFDARPLAVLSGSMEPTLDTGDVTVVKRIAPLDARPGDIVTFRDPHRSGRLVTHRVRAMELRGSQVIFTTRGDANNVSEHWQVSTGDQISRVIYRIPDLGHLLMVFRSSRVPAIMFGLALGLLLVLELVGIWRPTRGEERA